VVKVEQQLGAGGFDALGHAEGIGEVVDLHLGAVGVHENAKAKSVGAVRAEDGDGIARSGAISERAARLLDLLQGRDVAAHEHWRAACALGRGRATQARGEQRERRSTDASRCQWRSPIWW